MGYQASDKILPAEYNAFLTNTSNSGAIAAYGINHIMGTGLLNLGLGQTALHTVNTAEKITVAQWNSLWTAMNNIQNHSNITELTSTASREVGDVIAVKAALLTDLNALATAVQGGSTSATGGLTTSASVRSVTTAAEGWDSTATHEIGITWASANAMRFYFNQGGKVRIVQSATASSLSAKDNSFVDLGTGIGNLDIGSQSTTRSGSAETLSTDGLAIGFYDMTTSYQTIIKMTSDNSTYTSNTVEISAKLDASPGTAVTMTIKMVATDGAADDQYTAGNTASVPSAIKDTPQMVTTLYMLRPNTTEGLATVYNEASTAEVSNTTT